MRLGLFEINMNVCASDPAAAVQVAQAAEAAGWESVWAGEHYVLPDPRVPPAPVSGATPILDPFVALTNVAVHTRTLRLGTGVTVVPWHHPLLLAKQVASVDRVSGGRFLFGLGVGYLESEFQALGVPMAGRGARTVEAVDAMTALWTEETPSFQGTHVSFSGMRAEPRPLQRPGPPLHFGGYVTESFRRAVTRGHGWYGFALDPEAAGRTLEQLRRVQDETERPADLGPLEVTVTPPPGTQLTEEVVEAYAELGVTRLVVLPPREGRRDPAEQVRFVEDAAQRLATYLEP